MRVSCSKREHCTARQRRAGHRHRLRHAAVSRRAVAQLSVAVESPRVQPCGCPREHQIIAGAAEVTGHKLVGHTVVTETHHLPLGEVAEGAIDEAQAGVFHHGERRAGCWRIAKRQIDGAARGGKGTDGHRNSAATGKGRCQRIGNSARDDDGVGQCGDVIRRSDDDADGVVAVNERDRAASGAGGGGNAVDLDGGINVRRGGSESNTRNGSANGGCVAIYRGAECGRERPGADRQT